MLNLVVVTEVEIYKTEKFFLFFIFGTGHMVQDTVFLVFLFLCAPLNIGWTNSTWTVCNAYSLLLTRLVNAGQEYSGACAVVNRSHVLVHKIP